MDRPRERTYLATSEEQKSKPEPIVVYDVLCMWWDYMDKVSTTKLGLPCCPNCGNIPLYKQEESEWWSGVVHFQSNGHPGYRRFVEWNQGKCFTNSAEESEPIRKNSQAFLQKSKRGWIG